MKNLQEKKIDRTVAPREWSFLDVPTATNIFKLAQRQNRYFSDPKPKQKNENHWSKLLVHLWLENRVL